MKYLINLIDGNIFEGTLLKELFKKGEKTMGTPREILETQILALGQQSLMGVQVDKEKVNRILRMCNSEEDKKVLRNLCDSFGLKYSE